MSRSVKAPILALMLTLGISSANAACTMPSYPSLPDGNTAALAQMVKAKKEVKAFVVQSRIFLDCNSNELKTARASRLLDKAKGDYYELVGQYKMRVRIEQIAQAN